MTTVYAGGPIDYGRTNVAHELKELLGEAFTVYCPQCSAADLRAKGDQSDESVMKVNEIALLTSTWAVFDLSGSFTVGTPIEAHTRLKAGPANRVVLVHPARPGLFVRVWVASGAVLVHSVEAAAEYIKAVTP